MTSGYQRPATLDLYREWSKFVDREELFVLTEIPKSACDLLEFLLVVRIITSQNLFGFAVAIARVLDD